MKTIKIKPNNCILFIVLFLSILPVVNISRFEMPVLYWLTPICAVILFLIILGRIKILKVQKNILIIFFLIIIEIFISTIYGTVTAFGEFIFPNDIIQYVARFLFLTVFIVAVYNRKVHPNTFIKYFLIFLNIGMLIGILQWIPWFGREFFIKLYPFREGIEQLSQLNRQVYDIRIHGLAQMATANGGLATFFFIFGCSVFIYYKKYRLLSTSLMILSFINILASQARAGILALTFSFTLFYFIDIYINKKSFKSTLYLVIAIPIILFIFVNLYNNSNQFIYKLVYRWQVLFDTNGGARVDQIKYSLGLLENPCYLLLGISRAFQSHSGLGFYIEVEPVNIFVLYGLLGFLLQYFLVFYMLFYFLRNIRESVKYNDVLALQVASFIGLFSYQVFSVGYFFFKEIRVGLFPWILMGVSIGAYERYKFNNRKIRKFEL